LRVGEGLAQDDEAALRVADQEQRYFWLGTADQPAGRRQVGKELVELTDMHTQPGALSVASVVMGPAIEARVGEVVEHMEVSARVLGKTMNDEKSRTGLPIGGVSPPEEAVAVGALRPALFDLQRNVSRRSARTRSTA
jgi:hypothetical protein